ncbi:MAG: DUF2795 domain-containing protein [Methanosarcina sp.]
METENKIDIIKEMPMEIQKILKNINFPINKSSIIEQEKENGAISDILRELGMLPDRTYDSAEDVARELHKLYIGIPN